MACFKVLRRPSRQCAVLLFCSLGISGVFRPLRAQTFDATNLHGNLALGAKGIVFGGDDPAFASPGFDDSRWTPIDEKKSLRAVFSTDKPNIIWQRLHIKVNPAQTGMGVEAIAISPAYEVYVNGQKLIESGQVEPFRRYSQTARNVAPIPDGMVRTGTLTIAIRYRMLRSWFDFSGPGFPPLIISLGQEEALRNRAWMSNIRRYLME